jgi:(1->4)-alpha-D-glucan 1-alpha-D-glucosylmutase
MRVPVATYRVQFNRDFGFAKALSLVDYLHSLGISDLYASPLLKARSGSLHCYDVTDPRCLNPELGTEEEFEALVRALKMNGMGLLLDIVPNHMAAHPENPWWRDVLETGPSSPYASYFDLTWGPSPSGQEQKLLLPILGDPYGQVLESGQLAVALEAEGFLVRYYDWKLPLSLPSYREILSRCLEALVDDSGPSSEAYRALARCLEALEEIIRSNPPNSEEARALKEGLWNAYRSHPSVKKCVDEVLRQLNGTPGQPESFHGLHRLLDKQAYRLSFWRRAMDDLAYRRFFDINDMVCLRMEEPEVFEAVHHLVLGLIREGKVTGLRIDHIDGLYDPVAYLHRLEREVAPAAPERPSFYIVVEKILMGDESLPEEWPVCGTTGYEFIHDMNGVFVHSEGLVALDGIYARFTGFEKSFAQVCYGRKKQVMEELFSGEVRRLAQQLVRLACDDRHARDLPEEDLLRALVEVTAWLPIYRTYIRDLDVRARDRAYIEKALDAARRWGPKGSPSPEALDFMERVLLLKAPFGDEAAKKEWLRFVMRWQQFTGPVMAKGLEDTALYLYNRLVSLKEVGTDPFRTDPPVDIETFHESNKARLKRWPYTLNTTSTHDTKRSEDVRARINVLSEIPTAWDRRLSRWSRWNRPKKPVVNERLVPDPNMEVLIYQTLLGAWPLRPDEEEDFRERLKEYLIKAAREAKVHTSWIRPDADYEQALLAFVDSLLEPSEENPFREDFLRFQRRVAFYGALNALGQVVLKVASPGVPDFYQGTELWDFSLVDPDNRRPVDFAGRAQMLGEIKKRQEESLLGLVRELTESWEDGRIKLFVTYRALRFRQAHRELFLEGDYTPLEATGTRQEHICAFARSLSGKWTLALVARWLTRLTAPGKLPLGRRVWGDTALLLPKEAPYRWENILTGEVLTASSQGSRGRSLPLHRVFETLPVALLRAL